MGWTFYNSSGQRLSTATTLITNLDIDGATDIGAAIVDADLFIIDDGAGGTNRKTAASRIKTYVAAPSQANQAALEAETNEDTYAPPDLIKHNPGVVKTWSRFINTSIDEDLNVSSVTDTAVGDWAVQFTIAASTSNYPWVGMHLEATDANISGAGESSTTQVRVFCRKISDQSLVDPVRVSIIVMGDQ